jgi:hypothetical protein
VPYLKISSDIGSLRITNVPLLDKVPDQGKKAYDAATG